MAYILTIKDAIWHINGKKITIPRDQNFDPVALAAGIDKDGNIVPLVLDPDTNGLSVTVSNSAGNPVPVTIVSGGGSTTPVLEFASISTVAGSAITTILTYINVSTVLWLDGFIATGTVDAEFLLVLDTIEKIAVRTAEMDRTAKIFFPRPIRIEVGVRVDIKVTHWHSTVADFKATLIGQK